MIWATGRAFRYIFCSAEAPQKDVAAIPVADRSSKQTFILFTIKIDFNFDGEF